MYPFLKQKTKSALCETRYYVLARPTPPHKAAKKKTPKNVHTEHKSRPCGLPTNRSEARQGFVLWDGGGQGGVNVEGEVNIQNHGWLKLAISLFFSFLFFFPLSFCAVCYSFPRVARDHRLQLFLRRGELRACPRVVPFLQVKRARCHD